MNTNYQIKLNGKVIEVVKPDDQCFIKIQIDSFLLEIPCPSNCEFRLEDKILVDSEIRIHQIFSQEEINNKLTNKSEVQDER